MRISCAKPKISSYDFMRYLCAILAKEKKIIIDLRHIVDHLYEYKMSIDDSERFIFEDIEFRASIDNVISYDISESLNNLQTFGIIGKLNPNYEKIVIYLTEDDANRILQSCDEISKKLITRLADRF